MTTLARLRGIAGRLFRLHSTDVVDVTVPAVSPDRAGAFSSVSDAASIRAMGAIALAAYENRDVPSLGRASDHAEALADERQDQTTGANFPLHWTSAVQSWNYLFDCAVACELLAPRPDDLVLDFAAGTCWATELLNRIGVRTVAIDLSVEMMRRGRRRLASDARLVFRDEATFVAARGQALPFQPDSFDGVICMNALHHVPSYAEALREIHRVLKPGGRAVFSEPGTAHASQPLSRFRMREERIIEKSVSLPLVRRLALDVGFSRMRVVPLRSAAAYVFEYSAAPAVDDAALQQIWDDTLKWSPTEHARFVLHKGDDRPEDSLLPAPLLGGKLRAVITLEHASATVPVEQPFTQRIRVLNSGGLTWRARGRRFGGQVTLGMKLCDDAGTVLRDDLGRTALPRDMPPGAEVELQVTVAGVLATGVYQLRYDMVVEGVVWFELDGSATTICSLEVTS